VGSGRRAPPVKNQYAWRRSLIYAYPIRSSSGISLI
jgi:hypothetical protein